MQRRRAKLAHQIEFRTLKHFLRTCELGSISKAAFELRIAQPALSRQMRQLEEELGTALFIRDGRGVILTDTGAKFRDEVIAILQRLENAYVEARNHGSVPSGEVRLGVLPNLGPYFTADLVLECRKEFPQVKLTLCEGFSYQLAGWIQNKEIDLGFIYDVDKYRNLHPEFVFREKVFLAGAPNRWKFSDRVSLSEFEGLPLIVPAPPSYTKQRINAAARNRDLNLTFLYELDSLLLIKRLISLGEGYGIFARSGIWQECERGEIAAAEIVDYDVYFELSLATAYGTVLPAPAKALIDFLRRMVHSYVAQGRWIGKFVTTDAQARTSS